MGCRSQIITEAMAQRRTGQDDSYDARFQEIMGKVARIAVERSWVYNLPLQSSAESSPSSQLLHRLWPDSAPD